MHHQHQDDLSGPSPYHPKSGEHYYPPADGPKDNHLSWSPHMASYDHHVSQPNVPSVACRIIMLTHSFMKSD